jgi:hypothetical protein
MYPKPIAYLLLSAREKKLIRERRYRVQERLRLRAGRRADRLERQSQGGQAWYLTARGYGLMPSSRAKRERARLADHALRCADWISVYAGAVRP